MLISTQFNKKHKEKGRQRPFPRIFSFITGTKSSLHLNKDDVCMKTEETRINKPALFHPAEGFWTTQGDLTQSASQYTSSL